MLLRNDKLVTNDTPSPPYTLRGIGICHQEFTVVLFDLVCRDARKGGDVYVFHGLGF